MGSCPEMDPQKKERQTQDMTQLLRDNHRLKRELDEAQTSLARVHEALAREQHQRREGLHLSSTRAKELEQAQLFLSKTDKMSCADVKGLVDALNNEIHQFSSMLTDFYLESASPPLPDGPELTSSKNSVAHILGNEITEILIVSQQSKDAIVQTSIQALLCKVCQRFLDSWTLYDDLQLQSDGLKTLYERISNSRKSFSPSWCVSPLMHCFMVP